MCAISRSTSSPERAQSYFLVEVPDVRLLLSLARCSLNPIQLLTQQLRCFSTKRQIPTHCAWLNELRCNVWVVHCLRIPCLGGRGKRRLDVNLAKALLAELWDGMIVVLEHIMVFFRLAWLATNLSLLILNWPARALKKSINRSISHFHYLKKVLDYSPILSERSIYLFVTIVHTAIWLDRNIRILYTPHSHHYIWPS